jgi:hypothetical protein
MPDFEASEHFGPCWSCRRRVLLRDVELLTVTKRRRQPLWTGRSFCGACAAQLLEQPELQDTLYLSTG